MLPCRPALMLDHVNAGNLEPPATDKPNPSAQMLIKMESRTQKHANQSQYSGFPLSSSFLLVIMSPLPLASLLIHSLIATACQHTIPEWRNIGHTGDAVGT